MIKLPLGCVVRDLKTHDDDRGNLTEIFRQEWDAGIEPVQWNFVRSQANVLRGIHVHVIHSDYLVCLEGTLVLALSDIRPESPTHGMATTVTLKGSKMQAALVPPGVAHGFHFPEVSSLCYSVSHYWNTVDEIGCRWDDPALGLDWDIRDPALSPRDTTAGSAAEMTQQYLAVRAQMSAGRA
ncbi:dTDP-4-dehydrorhamnose 3,5-epimerase family protein [Aminobacter sp. NyZ550]|uniref:dTDP-4-dehydrorhamnose 3,5-epimerase family protein n=1 Tax=Aminobacter sp. NyZ550 TaxID=2979870 RepID=UPI0021D6115E|nr:dTDP-4-dehydrorhamnose 3,5-epimerase family protein [Aminobacter sp. NyZ550]WAX95770.1 dTDP-4-dehydrorhamnose 3,5-epimerase family protein [Aminobacter sp. NyZ550]